MRLKRGLFVSSLIVLFLICYAIMNQRSDELARYKYATNENSDIILEALNTEEINYLIDRQFTPEEFMPYLNINGFNIRHVNYYNACKEARFSDDTTIVYFVNRYFEKGYKPEDMTAYLTYYDYITLNEFMYEGEYYGKSKLVSNINDSMTLAENETLYAYVPSNLKEIKNVPNVNQNKDDESLYLREDANDALIRLCDAATVSTGKTCGNMIAVKAYMSLDEQQEVYDEAILRYGNDDAPKHASIPGTDLAQLGNRVSLVIARADLEELAENELSSIQKWMIVHASEFGFTIENDMKSQAIGFDLCYQKTGESK